LVDLVGKELSIIVPGTTGSIPALGDADARLAALENLRDRAVKMGSELPWEDRGAILALLGSAERAFYLITRIDDERKSVPRPVPAAEPVREDKAASGFGQAAPVPA
jgi:phosphate:Na+ symporter